MILLTLALSQAAQGSIDFDRDVRPILSDNCFACHGPDAGSRAADLRLDTREGATADLEGYAAVVPGDVEESELWARVTSEFDFDVMPPPDSHKKPLGAREQEVLKRWIEAGAPWSTHWAFVPPVKVAVDGAHPVDAIVETRLREEGLGLSAQATTRILARRLSFDLVGLPPTPRQLEDLGPDPTDERWSGYVNELLSSPYYGERMAMWWLDGARYADTDGFQQDELRTNWPWRDWVVGAFNDGMPFDEFAELQIAGDLFPDATEEQVLATCFQRNHMHNGEGGRHAEESRVDYVRDRTNTLGTVFLGLTLECAQCHDHKFDPVSQRDYYSLSAFFDSIDESGRAGGGAKPFLQVTSPAAAPAVARAERELAQADAWLKTISSEQRPAFEAWKSGRIDEFKADADGTYSAWSSLHPDRVWSAEGSQLVVRSDGRITCASRGVDQEDYSLEVSEIPRERITAVRLEVLRDVRRFGEAGAGFSFTGDGEFIITGLKLRVRKEGEAALREIEIAQVHADVEGRGADEQNGPVRGVLGDDPRQGWTTMGKDVDGVATAVAGLREPLILGEDETLIVEVLQRSTVPGAHARSIRVSVTDERGQAIKRVAPTPQEALALHVSQGQTVEVDAELDAELFSQFLEDVPAWRSASWEKSRFKAQLQGARKAADPLSVTVLRERSEPRVTSILERGVWDQKGEEVERGVLTGELAFGDLAAQGDTTPTRLDLARWITAEDNPLTARVIVNQIWQQLFGRGLVATPSDFGLQGARPRYPKLLDWLAVDFVESGWDLRHLVRTIVTSRVYAQASETTVEELARDPYGELLNRGPRFRLPSWMIRDAALRVSGLLVDEVGGPPMYPHQPPGVWEDVFNGRFRYEPTLGEARHRRTLYAFWRRNAAPTYLFDTADRRTCAVDVRRTNTPLQALTLLNDRTYADASAALAESAYDASSSDLTERLGWLARAVLQRTAADDELEILHRIHAEAVRELGSEQEACALVAATLLNLDEAINHE